MGTNASSLIPFISDIDGSRLNELCLTYKEEKVGALRYRIKQGLSLGACIDELAYYHPAWVFKHLLEEPVAIIGILLRVLPSNIVKYALSNMPETISSSLPKVSNAFSVNSDILQLIMAKFIKKFPHRVMLSNTSQNVYCSLINTLSVDNLNTLFHYLGLLELAYALMGMPKKALKSIYHRLSLKDARMLQTYIYKVHGTHHIISRYAKNSLLTIEDTHKSREDYLSYLGLSLFARSNGSDINYYFKQLIYRLPPALGQELRHSATRSLCLPQTVSKKTRSMVYSTLSELLKSGAVMNEKLKDLLEANDMYDNDEDKTFIRNKEIVESEEETRTSMADDNDEDCEK